MHIKSIFFFLCLISTYFSCIAQFDFHPGYIITHEHDTLWGELQNRLNRFNYLACKFKQADQLSEYGPKEIQGFGYTGGKYFSSVGFDTAFAEVLVGGLLSLYKIRDIYAVQKAGDTLFILENTTVEAKLNYKDEVFKHGRGEFDENKWRGILLFLTQDCEVYRNHIPKMPFNQKELIRIVKGYNDCVNAEYIEYKESIPWFEFDGGIVAAYNRSSMGLGRKGTYFNFLDQKMFDAVPSFGIAAEFSFPRVTERLSLLLEMQFVPGQFETLVLENEENVNQFNQVNIDANVLAFPIAVKYKVPLGKAIGNVHAGAYLGKYLKLDTRLIIESQNTQFNIVETEEITDFELVDEFIGPMAGIGLSIPIDIFELEVFARYAQIFEWKQPRNNRFLWQIGRLSTGLKVSIK